MLLRKNCCRHEIRNLLAILNRLKRRAYSYFGFAVSDIAAYKSVHDFLTFHIAFCIRYRA